MAQFQPFRGLRPDPKTADLSQVVCPPYDVIKGDARDALLTQNPKNIVAIELAARYGEAASDADYQKCAQILEGWVAEGTLMRDDAAFYVYEQEFKIPNSTQKLKRRGVFGALTLEEFGAGVQPHEHTLSGPKADRLNLLRALRTNTSPIFGLVKDDEGWINELIKAIVVTTPHADFQTDDGISHRLWVVRDDETVNGLEAAFENESVLIADGHHRYETALNYYKERQKTENLSGGEGDSAVMMMCVSMEDDGLVVLPTHRVVKNVEIGDLSSKLGQFFDWQAHDSLESLETALNTAPATPNALGLVLTDALYLLTLKSGEAHLAQMDAQKSAAYNGLDVSILHSLILEKELGIDAEKLAAGGHVVYTIHAADAQKYVHSGEASAAFLLRATPVAQVQAVADAGDKMPQKSTYFYPKLLTGLVLRPLD